MGFLGILLTPALEKLDTIYPKFGSESRNVHLGLASDGFNPFGMMMNLSHNTWPVVMTLYNLPPWLCMKQPYLMLLLLIPSPKRLTFIMRAAVMWTINDFPAYDMLFSWSTEGAQYLASLSGLRWQFGMGKQIQTKCRRGSTKDVCISPWKKKEAYFFYLPYWKDLLIRHNLDVMHIEKNVTENVLGTLLGMD
ncbi:unnamed protein product [Prunus armeniaca]